jgi:hypothetical protein
MGWVHDRRGDQVPVGSGRLVDEGVHVTHGILHRHPDRTAGAVFTIG